MRSFNRILCRNTGLLIITLLFSTPGFAAQQKNTQTKTTKKPATVATNKKPAPASKKTDAKSAAKTTAAKTSADKKSAVKSNSKTTATKSTIKTPQPKSSASNAKSASNSPAKKTTPAAKTASKTSAKTSNSPTQAKTTKKSTESIVKTSTLKPAQPVTQKTAPASATREPSQAIVTVAAARVRAEPNTAASEIRRVKLGTLVKVTDESPAWYKVEFSGSPKSGWMSKQVAKDFDENNRTEIYRQIVDRNYKTDNMAFVDAAELYEFLTRAQNEFKTPEIEYKRLLVLRSALKAMPFNKDREKPYSEFLKANDNVIVFSEPSAEWYVRSELLWDLHKKHSKETIAEEIAWTAAQNPLPGECEGYINCYLFVLRVTDGEYLDRYPNGKYAEQSLKNIQNLTAPIAEDLKEKKVYNGPSDVSDRAEFNKLIAELRTIISKLPFAEIEKQKTIQQLNRIAEGYR